MSSNLGAGKILELVERLRGTVRDLAARAEKLNEDFHARTAANTASVTARRRSRRRSGGRLAEAEAELPRQRRPRTRFEARKDRIGKAYQGEQGEGPGGLETQTGARKYKLQKRMLQAERDRTPALQTPPHSPAGFPGAGWRPSRPPGARLKRRPQGFQGLSDTVRLLRRPPKGRPPRVPGRESDAGRAARVAGQRQRRLEPFRLIRPVAVFKYWPVWLRLILCEIPLVLQHYGLNAAAYQKAGFSVAGSLVVLFGVRYGPPARRCRSPQRSPGSSPTPADYTTLPSSRRRALPAGARAHQDGVRERHAKGRPGVEADRRARGRTARRLPDGHRRQGFPCVGDATSGCTRQKLTSLSGSTQAPPNS